MPAEPSRASVVLYYRKAVSRVVIAITGAMIVACAGSERVAGTSPTASLASCSPGTALLTVSPIALNDIGGWVPLGATNPPGHTFPTDHQYIYLSTFTTPSLQKPVELVSPDNVTITRARRTTYSTDNHTDYAVAFSACKEVAGELAHVATIVPSLLARLGSFDQGCDSYSPQPGLTSANQKRLRQWHKLHRTPLTESAPTQE